MTGPTTPPAGIHQTRSWVLPLPFTKPLSLNDRAHHMAHARLTKAWRDATIVLARKHKIPRLERFTVVLHYAPRNPGRRDPDNLIAALKPCIDGMIAAGIADDDDHTRHHLTAPVIHPPTGEPGRLWLIIVDLSNGDTP